jgi:hypothetical protein
MPGGPPMMETVAVLSEVWVEDEPGPLVTFDTF